MGNVSDAANILNSSSNNPIKTPSTDSQGNRVVKDSSGRTIRLTDGTSAGQAGSRPRPSSPPPRSGRITGGMWGKEF